MGEGTTMAKLAKMTDIIADMDAGLTREDIMAKYRITDVAMDDIEARIRTGPKVDQPVSAPPDVTNKQIMIGFIVICLFSVGLYFVCNAWFDSPGPKTVSATTSSSKTTTITFSSSECQNLGYHWGRGAAFAMIGETYPYDFAIPEPCRGLPETQRGIDAGVRSVLGDQ